MGEVSVTYAATRRQVFNTALEYGFRAVCLLATSYPAQLRIQVLADLDHLIVHSADAGGPPSLHAAVPLRSSELLIRRSLMERGLLLMISRGLITRSIIASGFGYSVTDDALPFVDSFQAAYVAGLRIRAEWVWNEFGALTDDNVRERVTSLFQWRSEFQPTEDGAIG
jgi:ABC-3C biological conflict system middle component